MQFGTIPNLTDEQKETIKRHNEMAERMIAERKANPPTEYFKGERFMGGEFFPPGVKPPLTLWQQMKDAGEV
ncbi:MAG: hypothetical protein HQL66_05645 [Magnetococcales bacterium]|nr:hypothetical protein [Magnetococcales bacterium]